VTRINLQPRELNLCHNGVNVRLLVVKINRPTHKEFICHCPNAEPGKIKLDVSAHLPGCWIRKKLLTDRFTVNTSVTPDQFNDGYALGVAVSG
jgi:hypothetical protein